MHTKNKNGDFDFKACFGEGKVATKTSRQKDKVFRVDILGKLCIPVVACSLAPCVI